MAAPITSNVRQLRTRVPLDPQADGVQVPSAVDLDSVQAIRVGWLESLIVRLRPQKLRQIDLALHIALGIHTCPADAPGDPIVT